MRTEFPFVLAPDIEVQTDRQSGIGARKFYCLFHGAASHHQARAGDDAMLMTFDDAAIDTAALAEVIGIHNESTLAHPAPTSLRNAAPTLGEEKYSSASAR